MQPLLLPTKLLLPTLGLLALASALATEANATAPAPEKVGTGDLRGLVAELEELALGADPAPLVGRLADLGTRARNPSHSSTCSDRAAGRT